jgi:hypothetical protein
MKDSYLPSRISLDSAALRRSTINERLSAIVLGFLSTTFMPASLGDMPEFILLWIAPRLQFAAIASSSMVTTAPSIM